MLSYQQISDMLTLQTKLNDVTLPNWKHDVPAYPLAILSECTELMDGIGWKWWKKQDRAPMMQIQLEVVDILHFLLSEAIVRNFEYVVFRDLRIEEDPRAFDPTHAMLSVRRMIRAVAAEPMEFNKSMEAFCKLAHSVRLSSDEMYRLYLGKAAMNLFRWEHGYKEGTYIKIWDGVEDNYYLGKIMEARPGISMVDINTALTERYREITK